MSSLKLLVSDYNNTMEFHYDFTDNGRILDKNIKVINEFMQDNLFCVATGRRFYSIRKTLTEIDDFKNIRKYLNLYLKNSFIEYKYSKIKVINKDCNKIISINKIKRLESLNDKDIYTIGDDINDIKMISYYNGFH